MQEHQETSKLGVYGDALTETRVQILLRTALYVIMVRVQHIMYQHYIAKAIHCAWEGVPYSEYK